VVVPPVSLPRSVRTPSGVHLVGTIVGTSFIKTKNKNTSEEK